MLRRLRDSLLGARQRLSALGSGFLDTFVRDNKVIPVVLALLALFVFAYVVAGAFLGSPEEEPVANRGEVAQAQDPADPEAPEIQNRNLDSYAAYQFKDPFRQLVSPPETTTATTTPEPPPTSEDSTGDDGAPDGAPGGAPGASDPDGDGLSDPRELDLGLDPANPDTDGDGTPDGQEPEARRGGADGPGSRAGGPGEDGDGRGGAGRRGSPLPQSGGEVPLR